LEIDEGCWVGQRGVLAEGLQQAGTVRLGKFFEKSASKRPREYTHRSFRVKRIEGGHLFPFRVAGAEFPIS